MSRKVNKDDDFKIILHELRQITTTLASAVEMLKQQAATAAAAAATLSSSSTSSSSAGSKKSCSDYTFPDNFEKVTEIIVGLN